METSSALYDAEEEASVLKLSMQALKDYYGLNPGKHAKSAKDMGYQLGTELAKSLFSTATDVDGVVRELASYWVRNGIGEIAWLDRENCLLMIQNCSDCLGKAYGAGYTLCPFKEGVLEALLEAKLGRSFKVKEMECCGTLAPNCLFKVEMTRKEHQL